MALHHGNPKTRRSKRAGADITTWEDGLHVTRYDDGTVKVGGWDKVVEVIEVLNRRAGKSRGGAFVMARFRATTSESADQEKGD
jgi:hypothetical protein